MGIFLNLLFRFYVLWLGLVSWVTNCFIGQDAYSLLHWDPRDTTDICRSASFSGSSLGLKMHVCKMRSRDNSDGLPWGAQ